MVQPKKPRQVANDRKAKVVYVADFETTTTADDCRVWSWGLASLEKPSYDDVEIGQDIASFIERISQHNSTIYFHNLKFDGHFILDFILKNGYRYVYSDNVKTPMTFKSLISDMGKFYSITVMWENGNTTEFRDSWKKLTMSVARVAKSFKLDLPKGEIDYDAPRPVGHVITPEEEDYLRRDVSIVATAMAEVHANGMTRLTVASDSLAEYKRLSGKQGFTRSFPVLSESMDAEIRRAYRGGFTYRDPRFGGYITGSGLVLDVNSLYPSVMMNSILPHGEPQWVRGKVDPTPSRPLTIFSVTFTAKLKPDHIPCIQIKGSHMFAGTEYLVDIPEPATIMVTNIDWELYNEHYDIDILEYGGGWRFHAAKGMFDDYINKWGAVKERETGGKREIAKLHLNSLYGKFASNPNVTSKIPTLDGDKVKLVRGADETRPPVYTAVGVFITAFARALTIRAAQANYDVFAYADTDSLHLLTDTVPDTIDVHPTKMGAWKLEYHFDSAFYIRPKAYLERLSPQSIARIDTENPSRVIVHIAGLPDAVTESLTYDDMIDGKVLHGKLSPKVVPGGIVLNDVPFTLKL